MQITLEADKSTRLLLYVLYTPVLRTCILSTEYSVHILVQCCFISLKPRPNFKTNLIGHALKNKSKDTAWAIQNDNSKDIPKDLRIQSRLERVGLCLFFQVLFQKFGLLL